ncbi:hypothetical protein C8T65DRAFT_629710 [Cerioporus squamosus]|nr:hypothetical protein C8T65DRAFT_629710 [Cerioporus squamosus]
MPVLAGSWWRASLHRACFSNCLAFACMGVGRSRPGIICTSAQRLHRAIVASPSCKPQPWSRNVFAAVHSDPRPRCSAVTLASYTYHISDLLAKYIA